MLLYYYNYTDCYYNITLCIIYSKKTSVHKEDELLQKFKKRYDPSSLVRRHISHKFELEDTNDIKRYNGMVVDYDTYTKVHEVLYDEEEESCFFGLILDLLNGDLKVLT